MYVVLKFINWAFRCVQSCRYVVLKIIIWAVCFATALGTLF
jgi:hypothetical protein